MADPVKVRGCPIITLVILLFRLPLYFFYALQPKGFELETRYLKEKKLPVKEHPKIVIVSMIGLKDTIMWKISNGCKWVTHDYKYI